jgi:sugar phosphate isomerase/epimerase
VNRQYAVAHLQMLGLGPIAFIEAAQRCGYDAIGLRLTPVTEDEPRHGLLEDAALRRAVAAQLKASGLACNNVEVLRFKPDTVVDHLRGLLDVSAELGAATVTVHVNDPDFQRVVERFGRVCGHAERLGLHLAIEFLPWTPLANLAAAVRLKRAVGSPATGLLIDTLHFHRSDSSLAELATLPRDWFRIVHIADCPAATPKTTAGLTHTARRERLLPGEGAVDFDGILAALPADVPLTLEIPHEGRVAEMGYEAYSRHALAVTKARLER